MMGNQKCLLKVDIPNLATSLYHTPMFDMGPHRLVHLVPSHPGQCKALPLLGRPSKVDGTSCQTTPVELVGLFGTHSGTTLVYTKEKNSE